MKLLPLTFGLMFCLGISAQTSLLGNVINWTHGEAVIAHFGMFNGEMTEMGTISPDGTLNIPLDPDYFTSIKKIAEKEAAEAPEGWSMSYRTIASTFSCMFEENITTSNGEAIVSGLPELLITDKSGQTEYGYLYAVSSPEVAWWLKTYGEKGISPGYYLSWIYIESQAAAIGECKIPTYTGNGEEMYEDTLLFDVKLEKGWNVVKYEITEIFTSQTGKTYPSKTLVSRLPEVPDDLQWHAIGN